MRRKNRLIPGGATDKVYKQRFVLIAIERKRKKKKKDYRHIGV